MTPRKTLISFFSFFLFFGSGIQALYAQPILDKQWNVKTVHIDTSHAYRRTTLPTGSFDAGKVKAVDQYFTAKAVRGLFNGVVLFAQGDKIFTKAYGYADFRTREKLTVSSHFQLASISKTITATAVAMLIRDGRIDPEAPVAEYLEGFPYTKVTIAMLLSHKSGLPDYMRFTPGAWASTDPMGNEDMLAIMNRRKPKAYFAPGAMYKYGNTNYALLASVVEHVTGERFSDWVHRHIFEPVGMNDTFFCTDTVFSTAARMTTGHTSRRIPYRQNFLDGVLGDKGVYSTVEDLLRFDQALRSGFLLDSQWLDKAYTNYTDQVHPYGWGWRLYEYLGHDIAYHNGWWHGYKGRFVRVLNGDMTIVVLENQARSSFSIPTLMNIGQKLFDPKVSADDPVVESGREEEESPAEQQ